MSKTNNKFNLDLPADWNDHTVHCFMGPDDSGHQHMLTVVVDPDVRGLELIEFARDRIAAAANPMQSIEVLKDEEKTLANGLPAWEYVYKWVPADGKVVYQKNIYMIIGERGYTFMASFTKKTMKTIALEVEKMICSLEPLTE
nr:DcrB-related protein [candidate division Zixibacteria bacterium]